MHTRHHRAAVDTTDWRRPATPRRSDTLTLWAERPLTICQGRLVAVRLRNGQLELRLVDRDSGLGAWRSADRLITERQAEDWVANSRFRR